MNDTFKDFKRRFLVSLLLEIKKYNLVLTVKKSYYITKK